MKFSELSKAQLQNGVGVCSPATNSGVATASFQEQSTGFFAGLVETGDWPARSYCGNWTDFHRWVYILSDVGIWAAYFAIPIMLLKLTNKIIDTLSIKSFCYLLRLSCSAA